MYFTINHFTIRTTFQSVTANLSDNNHPLAQVGQWLAAANERVHVHVHVHVHPTTTTSNRETISVRLNLKPPIHGYSTTYNNYLLTNMRLLGLTDSNIHVAFEIFYHKARERAFWLPLSVSRSVVLRYPPLELAVARERIASVTETEKRKLEEERNLAPEDAESDYDVMIGNLKWWFDELERLYSDC